MNRRQFLLAVGVVFLLLLLAAEAGLVTLRKAWETSDVATNSSVMRPPAGGSTSSTDCSWKAVSNIGPVTWSESTWAGIYQHHKGEADAEFVVTPSKPSCGGRAGGTHHLSHDVTCLGLVSVERCRSGGRKTLEDKVAQEVKEATAKLSSTDS